MIYKFEVYVDSSNPRLVDRAEELRLLLKEEAQDFLCTELKDRNYGVAEVYLAPADSDE